MASRYNQNCWPPRCLRKQKVCNCILSDDANSNVDALPRLVVNFSRDLHIATCPPSLINLFPPSDPFRAPKTSPCLQGLFFLNRLPIPNMNSRNNNRYGSQLHQRDARSQLFDNNGYGYPSDGRVSPRIASAYRPAAPNSRGQYSASVLEELESQNDAQVEGLSAKVKMLKDVCYAPSPCDLRVLTGALDYRGYRRRSTLVLFPRRVHE